MKKLEQLAFALAAAVPTISALAQIQAHEPSKRIVTQPIKAPLPDNGVFACFAGASTTPPLNFSSP